MFNGASILVTGATGSFGQAFLRRLIPLNPYRLVAFSRDEQKHDALSREYDHPSLRWYVGDVRDQQRLEMAMRDIDIVVHAAAMKIIPRCEIDPIECINTNVTGAVNVINASMRSGIKRVVALSTDKACQPLNLYGASKLAAEKLFVAANNLSGNYGPRYSVVRYGNVNSSRGSVIPLFKQLAKAGKPITITSQEMTRFSISLDESVDLVLHALETMQGREIYVPQIPSYRILDLAAAIAPFAPRKIIGIRPGEKIHETLLTADEARMAVERDGRYIILPEEQNKLPDGFHYTSNTNKHWLSIEELRRLA